jgi:hypothetical protein
MIEARAAHASDREFRLAAPRLLPIAMLAGGLLPACAAGDASDLVRGHVMAGRGFDVKVEATRFVGYGGGGYSADAWGYLDRRFLAWHESVADFALCLPTLGFAINVHTESGLSGTERVSGSYAVELDGFSNGGHGTACSGPAHVNVQGDGSHPLDWLTVRLTAFCFVGFDLELRVGELLDLAAGLVGVDPGGDDGQRGPDV